MTTEVIATYTSYRQAEAAVDRLSDAGFPVAHTSIIGRGVRYVETVTGRSGVVQRLLSGAASGAATGLFVGALFVLFDPASTINVFSWLLFGVVYGAAAGLVIGAVTHLALGGRRDFASVQSMQAEAYEVVVDAGLVTRARSVLGLDTVVDVRETKPVA